MTEQQTKMPARLVYVVDKHEYVLENMRKILQKAGFETSGSTDPEKVMRTLRETSFDVLLLGGGIAPNHRAAYIEYIQNHKPEVRIVEHFGGPATILHEVNMAFDTNA